MTETNNVIPVARTTVKDPRTIITPHAFSVAEALLYTPLASPLKRAIAVGIDGLLITILAEEAGIVFVLLVLATSYLARRLGNIGRWAKISVYALMTLVVIYGVFENFNRTESSYNPNITGPQAVSLIPSVISLSLCETQECAELKAGSLVRELAATDMVREEAEAMLAGALDELAIDGFDALALKKSLMPQLADLPSTTEIDTATQQRQDNRDDGDRAQLQPEASKNANHSVGDGTHDDTNAEDRPSQYSVIEWAKGILNDLGLGFGWAAFYFTVFTAWFDGQTLGKKLMGIRVISLDGSKLGLWAAFGRYGGYGAGFATGLMGFLQIFWDANRQAIQDKISATVVIDLTKPRKPPEVPVSSSQEVNHG